jgi:hypothetical protein
MYEKAHHNNHSRFFDCNSSHSYNSSPSRKKKDDDNKEEDIADIAILLKDSELKKPNNEINAEFELVKMGNGLAGMLISDPYADKSHIQFTMKYGSYIDTDGGISHLESIWCYKEVKNMIHYIHFLTNFSELKMLI